MVLVSIQRFDHFHLCFQLSKILQNPSHVELQKSANQGRRCTWEKLSAIKANCGIELALDECVAILNHMRRLKRSAERAAAASSSSHGLATTVRFNASKRIPSWNILARENSTGSLEEDLLADVASSLHQGVGGPTARNWRTHRHTHDGSDSESESVDHNSWTRSGGPLMRTTSADKFIDFVQNLEIDTRMNKTGMGTLNNIPIQMAGRATPDRTSSSDTENEQRDFGVRTPVGNSSITVGEGDLLQPERIQNGIVFNVVRKEGLTPSNRSHDSEHNSSAYDSVAECVQIDCPDKEMDAFSVSENGDDNTEDSGIARSDDDDVRDKHVMSG